MPVEFLQQEPSGGSSHATCLVMMYDGSGRRISKTLLTRASDSQGWDTTLVTHYTGIGTEIRENYAGPTKQTKVVVNMPVFFRVTLTRLKPRSYIEKDILRLSNGGAILPKRSFGASRQGLGRYGIENADGMAKGDEFYLKNHLGSTMMVAQVSSTNASEPAKVAAAYDYRAFGEQVSLAEPSDKVTETFTGKELDDETGLSNHGARLLDPMLGMWISVDPKRFFPSPYLYMGNGYNPIRFADLNGQAPYELYGSLDAAAQDFAKLYNGLSIASDKEYGTIFYRKGDSYSYVNPTRGRTGSVNLSACVFEARTKGYQIVSSGHTHGRLTDEHGVKQEGFLEPSNDDYISEFTDENYTPYKENPLDPAYVVVPNGNLLKYGLDGVDVVPTEGIASDPIYQYDVDLLPEP